MMENGKISEKTVKTGIRTERMIQLTDGVEAGDSVLTTGILQANPGQTIKVRNVVNDRYAQ
jgi:membrane fusion protein (multidrug efflux system)